MSSSIREVEHSHPEPEEAARAQEEREALREELHLLRQRLQQESEARQAIEARFVQEIGRAEARTKGHLSYRLGQEIVNSGASPLRWLHLPYRLGRAYSQFRRDKKEAGGPQGASGRSAVAEAKMRWQVGRVFDKGGVAQALALAEREAEKGKGTAAELLIAYAGVLRPRDGQAADELIRAAYRAEKSSVTLRAMYWACTRAEDFRAVGALIREMESFAEEHPTSSLVGWLNQLREKPVYNTRVVGEALVSAPAHTDYVDKRVAYVLHNSLPYSSGGYATRAHGLATGLQEQGWEVVGVLRPGFPNDLDVTPDELDDSYVKSVDDIRYCFAASPARTHYPKQEYMLLAADRIQRSLEELRPEMVVAASAHLSALPALIAARRLGIPFVYEVRGFWEITRLSRKPSREGTIYHKVECFLEAFVAEEADLVFTLTEAMKDELLARGVTTEIRLLPNSCDPSRFQPLARDRELAQQLGIPDEVPVIGYIGTFVDYEGLEYLAQACAQLHERGRDFRLMLVGNENTSGTDVGRITQEIQETVAEAGIADKVLMPGRVPHEMVEKYYSLVDIVAFPRRAWPVTEMVSPMKPLEALSMEKAVVASNVRALAEMIDHGRTGLLFQKEDAQDLATKLEYLLDNPEEMRRLGAAGRQWVIENRRWDVTAQQMAEGLESLRASDGGQVVHKG
ncbi:glycosyltransferase family 4 protein [Aquibaculum sediminis]|uniref:glycosyltransferase family 4 protein n=1 Tax=Aquibaculum sediminis TaxID=3231907 RepID=UPI0034517245